MNKSENNDIVSVQFPPVVYSITDAALAELKEKYKTVPDANTKDGYKEIQSCLSEMVPIRTSLERARVDKKAESLNYGRMVDSEAKRITSELLSIELPYKEAKSEFDNIEDARINAITEAITDIAEIANIAQSSWLQSSLNEIKGCYVEIRSIHKRTDFGERKEYADEVFESAKAKIITAIDQRENYDRDQADLEQLRYAKDIADRKAHDEQVAKQREEREKQIAENARHEAEQREAQAIQDKEDAQKRAEQAENDAIEATARAEQDARDKLDQEAQAEREAAEKRERNTQHKAKINNEAVDAIIKASNVTPGIARKIVTAIAKKQVPHIIINY